MLRWMKWIAPVAGMALVMSFNVSPVRADDPTPPPTTAPAATASVTVSVVDGDGKAVTGATVTLVAAPAAKKKAPQADPNTPPPSPTDKPKATPIATGTTDADGKAILTNIPDGKYVARARLKGTGNGRETVTVVDQKDVSVTVTLKPRTPKAN